MFCALHDQLASLHVGRHAQLTRCFSAVAELLVLVSHGAAIQRQSINQSINQCAGPKSWRRRQLWHLYFFDVSVDWSCEVAECQLKIAECAEPWVHCKRSWATLQHPAHWQGWVCYYILWGGLVIIVIITCLLVLVSLKVIFLIDDVSNFSTPGATSPTS